MADEQQVAENTPEQRAAQRANEEQAALERTWPLWQVDITGDEALYVARAGSNHAEKDEQVTLKIGGKTVFDQMVKAGDPKPWVDTHRASVKCRARSEQEAQMMALRANPDCHTIESTKEITES